jgi:hypothetical protein
MSEYCCERFGSDQTTVCDKHTDRWACPDAMILEVRGGYGLPVRDGRAGYASSVIAIGFCPFCGASLPTVGDLED